MSERKLNCWEFKQCGRGPGGKNVPQLGECPVAIEDTYDGINSGKNAGRVCWAVAGTCCHGKVQGTFAMKRKTCVCCDFYQNVQKEEAKYEKIANLFDCLPENKKDKIFNEMTCKKVKAGERFIKQGETRDSAYIIQRGSCLVIVEKNGDLHPVDHRGTGDIVGVTSILTGEPQTAHIEAETDMLLLKLEASILNDISFEHPELSDFLTEIVARRFDSKRPVADRTISKYIASDIVGRGAFSIVYKGLHADLNMPVAIKMMKHDMAMNSEFLSHFRAEAKFLAKFNHENIVQVFDIEDRYRTLFIIMEYLTGNTLRSILRSKGRLSEERVVNFIIQICRGLQIAHQHGIVHQDIKPGNIFILPNDKIKILDFGLACPKGTENFLTGTPFYMSPEQVKCLPVDQRSDIYSLGLVVYRMLTGRKPFDGDDHWRVMEMRTQREIADPAALVPDINVSLREVILKACARDPDKRYQDVSEILGAIRSLASELGLVDANNYNAKRKMRMFYLVYDNHDTQKLEDAFKNFNVVMKRIGAEFRAGEIIDI